MLPGKDSSKSPDLPTITVEQVRGSPRGQEAGEADDAVSTARAGESEPVAMPPEVRVACRDKRGRFVSRDHAAVEEEAADALIGRERVEGFDILRPPGSEP